VGCGQSSASRSFAHSLTAAPRLHPHLHQKTSQGKPHPLPFYTGCHQQLIDSLRLVDLTPLQAQTSFGKDCPESCKTSADSETVAK
jgi:hypothetical protein